MVVIALLKAVPSKLAWMSGIPTWVIDVLWVVIALALVEKTLHMLVIHFPVGAHRAIKPNQITACLAEFNKQTLFRIRQINLDRTVSEEIDNAEKFDNNIRLVVDGLVEHIRLSMSGRVKDKYKDIFVSVFSYDQANEEFIYEFHFDFKKDWICSKKIPIRDENFKRYECVKIMNEKNVSTAYVLNRKDYAKGHKARFKTMKQYMGCKLESRSEVFGFLNIEFHNRNFFGDQDYMEQFMENHVFPFKLLLESQHLNRRLMNAIGKESVSPTQ